VIKETAVMDTLPIVSPVAAALALAEVLGFGLPVPRSVTVTPWLLDSTSTLPAIDLQFRAPDPFDALLAWALRFGVTVELPWPEQGDFAYVHFTHCGVRFQCYARLGTDKS
jgi:hypothetical protein